MSDLCLVPFIEGQRCKCMDQTETPICCGQQRKTASELIVPPSNATVRFLLQMFGQATLEQCIIVGGGPVRSCPGSYGVSATNLWAVPGSYAVPVHESVLSGE